MSDPIVTMSYNSQYLVPAPTFSYSTTLSYSNDIVVGCTYKITLNGYCIPKGDNDNPNSIDNVFDKMLTINNIFSSNGGALSIYSDSKPLIHATDIKVLNVSFNESNNNWSKFVPYTVELESNHLHIGEDLSDDTENILKGYDDPELADDLHSPNIVDIEKSKIKSYSESFNINVDDNIFSQISLHIDNENLDINPAAISLPPSSRYPTSRTLQQTIANNYYSISLTISAVGKHDISITDDQKRTLPAWEHAKRFVHKKLKNNLDKISSNFVGFLPNATTNTTLDQLQAPSNITSSTINSPAFALYDESINFQTSESDGSFEVTYSAIVKQRCLIPPNIPIPDAWPCSDSAIHTVTKNVTKTFNANQPTNPNNHDISISINGEIRGLIPGYNIGTAINYGSLNIDQTFTTGSFLLYQPYSGTSRTDRYSNAEVLFNRIFDFNAWDLRPEIKGFLGITSQVLQVNPASKIIPSTMNLTRNYLDGTISYNAEYDNTFNCPTNNYSVDISVEEPVPVIAEFVIPNNNFNYVGPSGFPFIQNLGTQTAKKINININGNVGDDYNRCCLGQTNNPETENLLNPEYPYFSTGEFALPSGLILPIINNDYVLTSKTKKISYPDGKFTISLAYTCATTCNIGFLAVTENNN
jgi:hypothetical protein